MKASTSFEQRLCPACGGQTCDSRGLKNDFRMLSCGTCATVYTDRSPNANDRQDYNSYYTSANLTVPPFINRRLDEIVATFERYRKNNRLLDVGCGAGSFLEAAERVKWEAFGLEVSQTAAEHVRSLGFDVFCGELDKANYADHHFDVVIASELFEHVPDPQALILTIARVLRPGGLLWATTPHGRGVSARLLSLEWSNVCPPEHLQLFSVTGIKKLLSDAGFNHVEIATHGTNPFEIVHGLRRRAGSRARENGRAEESNFNRVDSSYQLNEFLSEKPLRRIVKATLNRMLNASRLGDSLKIRAEK